jgi:hypothetical protein
MTHDDMEKIMDDAFKAAFQFKLKEFGTIRERIPSLRWPHINRKINYWTSSTP